MDGFVLFESGPEESYSRHLDKEVASQEYPYGYSYHLDFNETQAGVNRGDLNQVDFVKGGH